MKSSSEDLVRKIAARMAAACSPKRPLHLNEGYRPFFIIGSGRSGTTLLRRLLMTQGELYIPPETYVLGPAIRSFRRYGHLPWPVLCRIILSYFAFQKWAETLPNQDFGPLYRRVTKAPEARRSLAYLINELYLWFSGDGACDYKAWGDKTPLNAYYLDDIDSVFPNARYIHVIRDGCDVVSSMLAMGRYDDLASAANRWVEAIGLCQDFGRRVGARYEEVRYESLVTEPVEIAQRVCTFLSVQFKPTMVSGLPSVGLGDVGLRSHHAAVLNPIRTDSIGKGRRRLSQDQREALQGRIGMRLDELGYRPATE